MTFQTKQMKSKALSVKESTWMSEECHLVEDRQGNIQRNSLCLPNIFRSTKVKPLARSKYTYVVYHTAKELLLEALDRGAVREMTRRASGVKAGAHCPQPSHGKEQCTDVSEEEYAEALTCFSTVLQTGLWPGDDCCLGSELSLSLSLDGWQGVLKRNSFQTKLLSLSRQSDSEKLQALSDLCCHLARRYLALYTPGQNLAIKKYQLSHQQGPRCLHLALLCDMSSGFICSIYVYSPEQLQRRSRRPVLEQVVTHLLKHHHGHRHVVQLDSSAWMNGQLIFSNFELNINFVPAVKGSSMEAAPSSCVSPSVKPDRASEESLSQLVKHLDGWTGPALVLSSDRNESVDLFLPGLWATLHMVCINTFVLHTLQSQESGRRVHLNDFTRNLASQLAMDSSIPVHFMPWPNSTVHQETLLSNLCRQSRGQMLGRDRHERSAVARLQGWSRPGVCGLDNSGNSCYLNAALQCLCATVPLVEHLLHQDTRKALTRSKCHVAEVFVRLLQEMWLGGSPTCAPVEARSVLCSILPQFNNYYQQDAQELLLCLLNALHDDLKKAEKHKACSVQQPRPDQNKRRAAECTIVSQLFEGRLSYTSLCMDCGHQAHSTQSFTVLSLPIPATTKCCIQDCLSLFFEHTILAGEEQMLCSVCGLRRETAVVTCLDKPPEVLMLHLKRFGRKGKNQVKLRTNVLFSMTLNLSQFLNSSVHNNPHSSYHLFAVLNHTGNLNMGHYTALCRNALTGTWHCFDDSDVREVQDNVVQSPNAYVLVYSKEPFQKPKISGL
ncbi:ubiquitin carboxyl-terminal hydrolase 2-like [Betta splendens]|uniref:Ubiquitin carboxyl-terminal hydrolase n=1 Tax=Betta splendens TaxID=158456 RepID=A0A9W2XNC5_BETSP|nr:ubiquitin carboxyl-terminal hydrolase 2-like [Betta splendens]